MSKQHGSVPEKTRHSSRTPSKIDRYQSINASEDLKQRRAQKAAESPQLTSNLNSNRKNDGKRYHPKFISDDDFSQICAEANLINHTPPLVDLATPPETSPPPSPVAAPITSPPVCVDPSPSHQRKRANSLDSPSFQALQPLRKSSSLPTQSTPSIVVPPPPPSNSLHIHIKVPALLHSVSSTHVFLDRNAAPPQYSLPLSKANKVDLPKVDPSISSSSIFVASPEDSPPLQVPKTKRQQSAEAKQKRLYNLLSLGIATSLKQATSECPTIPIHRLDPLYVTWETAANILPSLSSLIESAEFLTTLQKSIIAVTSPSGWLQPNNTTPSIYLPLIFSQTPSLPPPPPPPSILLHPEPPSAPTIPLTSPLLSPSSKTQDEFCQHFMDQRKAGNQEYLVPTLFKSAQPSPQLTLLLIPLFHKYLSMQIANNYDESQSNTNRDGYLLMDLIGRIVLRQERDHTPSHWTRGQRIQNMLQGIYLQEMFDECLTLYPINTRTGPSNTPQEPTVSSNAEFKAICLEFENDQLKHFPVDGESDHFRVHNTDSDPQNLDYNAEIPSNLQSSSALNRIKHYMHRAHLGRAAKVPGSASLASTFTREQLTPLFPLGSPLPQNLPSSSHLAPKITIRDLLVIVKKISPGSAGGVDGLMLDHLVQAIQGSGTTPDAQIVTELQATLVDSINSRLAGFIHQEVIGDLTAAKGIPLLKPLAYAGAAAQIRPILCGSALRRLTSMAAVHAATGITRTIFHGEQYGVGIPNGIEHAFLTTQWNLDTDPEAASLLIDFKNAFNTMDKSYILLSLHLYCPQIVPWFIATYSQPSSAWFHTDAPVSPSTTPIVSPAPIPIVWHEISMSAGVAQGDPLGPMLYSFGLMLLSNIVKSLTKGCSPWDDPRIVPAAHQQQIWTLFPSIIDNISTHKHFAVEVLAEHGLEDRAQLCNVSSIDYLDDLNRQGKPKSLLTILQLIQNVHAAAGQHINERKCVLLLQHCPPEFPLSEINTLFTGKIVHLHDPTCPISEQGHSYLGSPLGTKEYVKHFLNEKFQLLYAHASKLLGVAHPQYIYHILIKSFVHRARHLYRVLPPTLTLPFAKQCDDLHHQIFSQSIHQNTFFGFGPLANDSPNAQKHHLWRGTQLSLPHRLGGMAIGSMQTVAYTAYISSLRSFVQDKAAFLRRSFPKIAAQLDVPISQDIIHTDDTFNAFVAYDIQSIYQWFKHNNYVKNPFTDLLGQDDITVASLATGKRFDQSTLGASIANIQYEHLRASLMTVIKTDSSLQEAATLCLTSLVESTATNAMKTFQALPVNSLTTLSPQEWKTSCELQLLIPLSVAEGLRTCTCSNGTSGNIDMQNGIHLLHCPRTGAFRHSHDRVLHELVRIFKPHVDVVAEEPRVDPLTSYKRCDLKLYNVGLTPINAMFDIASVSPMSNVALHHDVLTPVAVSVHDQVPMSTSSAPVTVMLDSRFDPFWNLKRKEKEKRDKYASDLAAKGITFHPFVLSLLGGWAHSNIKLLDYYNRLLLDHGSAYAVPLIGKAVRDISFIHRRSIVIKLCDAAAKIRSASSPGFRSDRFNESDPAVMSHTAVGHHSRWFQRRAY